jgi:EAL domain-containing protein (putative c-di-GMP-specific phosphodiesterase class I)
MTIQSTSIHVKQSAPFLDYYSEMDSHVHRIRLDPLPFRIGRDPSSHFVIHSGRVSRHHTEIGWSDGQFHVRDLGSTNRTYLNGKQVAKAILKGGDILHVGHQEFRFICPQADLDSSNDLAGKHTDQVGSLGAPPSLIHTTDVVREILRDRQIHMLFQPIVSLDTGDIVAFESLGRCNHAELSPSPAALLKLAEKCQMAPDISRLWRSMGIQEAARIPGRLAFFFNIHPSELLNEELVNSLAETAVELQSAGRRLVLEIHEDAMANIAQIRQFRDLLRGIGVGLAFDDFGNGQTRLAEMAEAPPDFIKIDMRLIRAIDQSLARQDMVGALTQVAARLGIKVIAEGIETKEEADTCWRLGCLFAQGFLFGYPAPAETYALCNAEENLAGTKVIPRQRLRELIGSHRDFSNCAASEALRRSPIISSPFGNSGERVKQP